MAFELYGMLAGNVSPLTGEPVKPAYGGDNEAFLTKVVKPIYDTIAKVCFSGLFCAQKIYVNFRIDYLVSLIIVISALQEAKRSKDGRAKHSQWRNYDYLNEYFWYYTSFFLKVLSMMS